MSLARSTPLLDPQYSSNSSYDILNLSKEDYDLLRVKLSPDEKKLFQEIERAFGANANSLCVMGIRSIAENVIKRLCLKEGIELVKGSYNKSFDELLKEVKGKFKGVHTYDRLVNLKLHGNLSLHEITDPPDRLRFFSALSDLKDCLKDECIEEFREPVQQEIIQ